MGFLFLRVSLRFYLEKGFCYFEESSLALLSLLGRWGLKVSFERVVELFSVERSEFCFSVFFRGG